MRFFFFFFFLHFEAAAFLPFFFFFFLHFLFVVSVCWVSEQPAGPTIGSTSACASPEAIWATIWTAWLQSGFWATRV